MAYQQPTVRDDYPHRTELPTRWMDNDIYGHVNNVQYYSYFDTAINEYLITVGGLDIHGGETIGVCAESRCTYLASIAFPAVVEAHLRVDHLGRSSVRYEIALFDADSAEPSATGSFVQVFVERASGRPVPIPLRIRRALERIRA